MLKPSRRWMLGALGTAALHGCGVVARQGSASAVPSATSRPASAAATPPEVLPATSRPARLTQEQQWARIAWRYVENNADYDTGLVGGLDREQVFTTWNAADALAAIVAAHELAVIDTREFDLRLSRVLGFLGTMDLSNGMLPNKAYNSLTRKMVAFDNRPADIGWSAVDVGRLMLWLRIIGTRHPRFAEYADKVVLRFTFCDVIDDCGVLSGSARDTSGLHRYQEGRLGYEQLAGAGFAAWGFEARRSAGLPALQAVNIHGLPVQYDARDPRTSGAQAPVLTMPFVYAGMELGWKHPQGAALKPLADQVFLVQQERWRRERQLTARTDYQVRQAPYVVLDSVFAAGHAWNTIGSDGTGYEKLALVAVKAAFGMWALWPGDYSQQLVENIRNLHDPDRGWFEGRLEAGGGPVENIALSTNAAVLEALLFRQLGGPFLTGPAGTGPFQVQTSDPFNRANRCWPRERAACTSR